MTVPVRSKRVRCESLKVLTSSKDSQISIDDKTYLQLKLIAAYL
jgi:hypothetical protein